MRPSATATTAAFGALIKSTNCVAALAALVPAAAAAAAAVGDGGGTDPGVAAPALDPATAAAPAAPWPVLPAFAAPATAFALAVALEEESEPHASCLPFTGKRASTRPVSVAITDFG